jgi:hypothetical protein
MFPASHSSGSGGRHLDAPHAAARRARHIPVGLEETLPRRLTFPIRRRFDAVCFQDIAGRPVGYGMSRICRGALGAVIAPACILVCHSQDELNDLLGGGRPEDFRCLLQSQCLATSSRCQRRMVSGVTMVASSSSSLRPRILPLMASRRRWPSLRSICFFPSFSLSM